MIEFSYTASRFLMSWSLMSPRYDSSPCGSSASGGALSRSLLSECVLLGGSGSECCAVCSVAIEAGRDSLCGLVLRRDDTARASLCGTTLAISVTWRRSVPVPKPPASSARRIHGLRMCAKWNCTGWFAYRSRATRMSTSVWTDVESTLPTDPKSKMIAWSSGRVSLRCCASCFSRSSLSSSCLWRLL